MQPRCSTWKSCALAIATLALLASCTPSGSAGPPTDKKAPPPPLAREFVRAGKRAGAGVGGRGGAPRGFCASLPEEEGVAGDLPAFTLFDVKKGQLAKLPAPPSAFGLNI